MTDSRRNRFNGFSLPGKKVIKVRDANQSPMNNHEFDLQLNDLLVEHRSQPVKPRSFHEFLAYWFSPEYAREHRQPSTESYAAQLWQNVGGHPFDVLFFKLHELFLIANDEQKRRLGEVLGQSDDRLWQLIYFIRRISQLIEGDRDDMVVRLAFDLAWLIVDQPALDFRDLIGSLLVIRYIAERHGIDVGSIIDSYLPHLSKLGLCVFHNVRNHDEPSLRNAYEMWGPKL